MKLNLETFEQAFHLIECHNIHLNLTNEADYQNLKRSFINQLPDLNRRERMFNFFSILDFLNDKHSNLIPYYSVSEEEGYYNYNLEIDELATNISYLKMRGIFLRSDERYKDFLSHNMINATQTLNKSRLLLDLRENSGGNIWVMLALLAPLFKHIALGFFKLKNGAEIPWGINSKSVFEGDTNHYEFRKHTTCKTRKVAVLISEKTASSGEALVMALKSLDNVRFFGNRTSGLTTSNETYQLNDGSIFYLSNGIMLDSNRQAYLNGIEPDVVCRDNDSIKIAKKWLLTD